MNKNIDVRPGAEDAAPAPPPRYERALLITVVVLAVLIVAGLGAVLARIIYLSSRSPAQPGATAEGAQGAGGAAIPFGAHLSLPEGAAVRSMSLSGNRLAVEYEAPGSGGIVILDLETGRTIARLRTEPAALGQ